jgi:hypothetical protein
MSISDKYKKRATATIEGGAREVNRTDGGRVRRKKDIRETAQLSFDPGDERAQVSVTRGFKSWFSTRDAGLTVESTVTVSVKCNQDEDSMSIAIDEAGKLAESQAHTGAEEMGLYITAFQKDTAG